MKKQVLTAIPVIVGSLLSIDAIGAMVIKHNMAALTPGATGPHLDESSTCNTYNLGVEEEDTDINPDFRPNMMVVGFDGFQYSSQAVSADELKKVNQFDASIVKPSVEPSRRGYKFVGWKVTGKKTCADFNETSCSGYENCVWKNNACVQNPCITCTNILAQAAQSMLAQDGDDSGNSETTNENTESTITCYYGTYDAETDSCSYQNSSAVLSLLQ